MKKRKILYLIPFAALVLSGCTFQEGWQATTGWLNKNVWTPVVEFFEGLFGKKDNKKEEEEDDPKPTPTPTPVNPEHAGTLEDPFTASDAKIAGSKVNSGEYTAEAYYIVGQVQEITEDFDPSYGSYTFLIEEGFKGYRMKNGENKAKFSEGDIEVGDEVLMYGKIQRYNDTYELAGTSAGGAYVVSVTKPAPTTADLESLRIEGEPQTRYAPGVAYNHNGLTATAVYEDGVEQDVTSAATWTISKATAAVGDTTIKITATFKTVSDSIDVEVTVSADPVHAGTLEDPYDGQDACLVASQLEVTQSTSDRHPTEGSFYIKGVVQEILEEFNSEYGNFTFTIENGFEGYRLKNGPSKTKFTSADDLVVGDTVTMYAQILNFKGTYETNDGYIYSIEKEPVVVESVVLSEQSLEIEKGQSVLVTASVLPAEASQEVTWSVEGELQERSKVGSTVVEYDPDTHILKGLDTGIATLVATSVADPAVSASCSIHVGEATKALDHIEIDTSNAKTNYVDGEEYSSEGLVVTAVYDDESTEDVTALGVEWTFNPTNASLGDDEVAVTATYEGQTANATINNITVSEEHGTLAHPYTVAEARAAVDAGTGITGVYARGIVTSIAYQFSNGSMSFYFSDDGTTGTELEAYKLAADSDPNVEVGDTVTVFGNLTKYNSTYEFAQGCTLAEHTKPTVLSVEISGTPSQTEYAPGASYNHNGLVATATLDNNTQKDVSALATWEISPATATLGDEEISIVATYNNVQSNAFVVNVTVSQDAPTEETVSWTATAAANLGEKISAVNGTDTGTISTGSYSWNYTRTLLSLADNKTDNISWQGSTWIQLGSNNAMESLVLTTSAIPGTIKSVSVVCASAGSHKLTIDVGGTKYLENESLTSYSGTSSATNPDPANCVKTGTGSSSGTITISFAPSEATKKAMLIRSITVVYEE